MSDSPFTRPVIRPDADILARVPGLCLGCLVHEVEVEPSRPDCQDYLDNELAPRLVARMEGEPLAQWPNLGPSRAGCKACGKDLPYVIDPRRPGDIAECYADPAMARDELGWTAEYGIEEMCASSWKWQSMNPNGYKG